MRKTPNQKEEKQDSKAQQPLQLKPEDQSESPTGLQETDQLYKEIKKLATKEDFAQLKKELFDAVKAARYEGQALLEKKVDELVVKADEILAKKIPELLVSLQGYPGAVASLSTDIANLNKTVIALTGQLASHQTAAPQGTAPRSPPQQPEKKPVADVFEALPEKFKTLVEVAAIGGKPSIKKKEFIPRDDWNAINTIVKGYGYRWNKDAGAWQ